MKNGKVILATFSVGFVIIAVLAVSILAMSMSGCAPSREERMQSRWNDFVAILPPAAKDAIDSGEYRLAAQRIDSALQVDTAFAARWSEMKKSEAIELFSTGDVIDYFVTYFGTD